jgi:hypothetical protein
MYFGSVQDNVFAKPLLNKLISQQLIDGDILLISTCDQNHGPCYQACDLSQSGLLCFPKRSCSDFQVLLMV